MVSICLYFTNKPSEEQLQFFQDEGKILKKLGILSEVPMINPVNPVIPSHEMGDGFWVIVLQVPEKDRLFWLGFISGKKFAVYHQ